jgi:hypothetical protein
VAARCLGVIVAFAGALFWRSLSRSLVPVGLGFRVADLHRQQLLDAVGPGPHDPERAAVLLLQARAQVDPRPPLR